MVLWPIGPKSPVFLPLLSQVDALKVGYFPGPILQPSDHDACIQHGVETGAREKLIWWPTRTRLWGCSLSWLCQRFIVQSNANARHLISIGIPEECIFTIPSGVDLDEYEMKPTFNAKAIELLFMDGPCPFEESICWWMLSNKQRSSTKTSDSKYWPVEMARQVIGHFVSV